MHLGLLAQLSSGGPGNGPFGALGGLVMVISVFLMLRRQPPMATGKLVKAGAITPETALKPTTVKITRPSELDGALRARVVNRLEDGRYWVDVPRLTRRRIILAITVALALGVAMEGAWLFLRWVKAI